MKNCRSGLSSKDICRHSPDHSSWTEKMVCQKWGQLHMVWWWRLLSVLHTTSLHPISSPLSLFWNQQLHYGSLAGVHPSSTHPMTKIFRVLHLHVHLGPFHTSLLVCHCSLQILLVRLSPYTALLLKLFWHFFTTLKQLKREAISFETSSLAQQHIPKPQNPQITEHLNDKALQ